MLETSKTKLQQVAVEPVNVEARVFEEGTRLSAVILPPVGKMVKGAPINRVETFASQNNRLFKEPLFEQELHSLLELRDRFSDSPTFLSRVASLLQTCGDSKTAVEYASQAAEKSPSLLLKQRLGEAYLEAGDRKAACQIFQELGDKGYVDAFLRLAEIAISDHDFDGAQKEISRALSVDELSWRARLMAGTLALATAEYEQAVHNFRVVLDERPNSAITYQNLAITYYLSDQADKAVREARKAVGINPLNLGALRFLVDVSMFGIFKNIKNKSLGSVERSLEQYLSFFPDEKSIVERLAHVYYKEGKIREGIGLLERVKNLFDDPETWNNLGVFWLQRKLQTGLSYFRKAIETVGGIEGTHKNRSASIAVLNYANALIDVDEYRSAESTLVEFMTTAENDEYLEDEVLCRIPVSLAFVMKSQGKYEDSFELVTRVLRNERLHKYGRIDIATFLTSHHCAVTGDFDEALKYASLAYELVKEPENAELERRANMVINNLAFVLTELDRLDEAKQFVSRLHSEQSYIDHEFAYATKGNFALRSGHYEVGKALYEQAIAFATKREKKIAFRQKMNFELGRYWFNKGEDANSLKFFKKVVNEKSKDNVWAQKAIKKKAMEFLQTLAAKH